MIRVIVVADVRLYREGLVAVLRHHRGLTVEASASDAAGVPATFDPSGTDVAVVDLATSRGLDTVVTLLSFAPPARVVVVATDERDEGILFCARAGVSGYVTRDSSTRDLIDTIEAVARGETACTPHVAEVLLQRVASLGSAPDQPTSAGQSLTPRETEIVALIGEGLSNKEIAGRLSIEVATVKNHVHRVIEKLNIHRRGQVAEAMRRRSAQPMPPDLNPPVLMDPRRI